MPAAPVRTVLATIPDVEDRETHVCLITFPEHPDWPSQIELADYIPSTDTYGRGYMFDEKNRAKVAAALRAKGPAQ